MKAYVKWVSAALALCLVLLTVRGIGAAAAASSEASQDGVRVTMTASKDTVAAEEPLEVTVTIVNDSGKTLKPVSSQVEIPEGFELTDGQDAQNWEALNPGGLITQTLTITPVKQQAEEPSTETPSTEAPSTEAPSTEDPHEGEDPPATGDMNRLSILIPVMILAAAGVIALLIKGKRKGIKYLALLAIAGAVLYGLAPGAKAAEGDENRLSVSYTVTSEGKAAEISAVVTYQEEEAPSVVTRADAEAALAEIAWDFYMKGPMIQYDSNGLNTRGGMHVNQPVSVYYGGTPRATIYGTIEDATSDTSFFTVCSGYCYNVYEEALGYPLFGNRLNSLTMTMWRNSSTPDDMAILRWHDRGKGEIQSNYDITYGVTYEDWYEADEVFEFFKDYEHTLRVGDIIVMDDPGHAMLYVGHGVILDSNGGKYDIATGRDTVEADGTVDYNTIEGLFLNPNNTNFYVGNLDVPDANLGDYICVLRPLDILMKDDGDDDPGNDVFDPDYVLNTGKLRPRASSDTTPLKTSGYSITDQTYTRMDYPAMTIDRTVSITPYGTAVKGEEITYSVTIANGSNNEKYTAYRTKADGESYAGETYSDLWVVEHVPANTELVSAPGAIIEDGTLRWKTEIPAGESVTVSFTVKATGEIGSLIECGGGSVANIPSYTIVNRIGGKKLTDEAKNGMDSFFAAGKDSWNSNDGYRISASVNEGTHFAERVYNETTGLALDLPDVQKVADIFFTQYMFHEDYGLYLTHDESLTRYMYRLNEQAADEADRQCFDMLVRGFYGGVWCKSDYFGKAPRIIELRNEYLEPGDVLVYMNLTESESGGASSEERKVTSWRILVYLGEGRYASLNAEGRLEATMDTLALTSAFTYDLFVVLRPSQAYADLNAEIPAYEGNAPELTEEDMQWKYTPDISNILLNERLSARLKNIDVSQCIYVNGKFPTWIYSQIGIDVATNGTDNFSYADFMKNCFRDSVDESEEYETYGHHYYILEEPNKGAEKQYDMLMYYAGDAFATEEPVTSLSDLHPGDIVQLGSRSVRIYVTAVYQGDGSFLLNIQNLGISGLDQKIWTNVSFADDASFLSWLNMTIVDFAELYDSKDTFNAEESGLGNTLFEGYIIYRPSRAFKNINLLAQRYITESVLADDEKEALAALTPEDWKEAGRPINLTGVAPWFYGSIGVNLTGENLTRYLGDATVFNLRDIYWYSEDGSTAAGTWTLKAKEDIDPAYWKMLHEKLYGGTWMGEDESTPLTESDLEIGDIFCGYKMVDGKRTYWVGLYQGGKQFLVVQNGASEICFTDSEAAFSETIATDWTMYCILRPQNLAMDLPDEPDVPAEPRNLEDGPLTDAEKEALASIQPSEWSKSDGVNLDKLYPFLYEKAMIDVTLTDGYVAKTVHSVFNYLFTKPSGETYYALKAVDESDPENVYYHRIQFEECYGGTLFASDAKLADASLQTGDLFCARLRTKVGSTNEDRYWIGLYQGSGNFLVVYTNLDKESKCEVMTAAAIDSNTFQYYFVLRPEKLSGGEGQGGSDGALTDEQKEALASIQPSEWSKTAGVNLDKLYPWLYNKASIDVTQTEGYVAKTVHNVFNYLFVKPSGETYYALREADETDSANVYYHRIQFAECYGGTLFASDAKLADASLQIGDLFCARLRTKVDNTNEDRYWIGLYQGSGNFLVVYTNLEKESKCEVMTASSIDSNTFQYYFVLRPSNVLSQ